MAAADRATQLIDRTRRERIVLVGVAIPPTTVEEAEMGLDELGQLVDTAGADMRIVLDGEVNLTALDFVL